MREKNIFQSWYKQGVILKDDFSNFICNDVLSYNEANNRIHVQ